MITRKRATYKGFSTQTAVGDMRKGFFTADYETVKRDLLNFIYTIPGERVMMPEFGTRIPLLAFEPLDTNTLKVVREDLTKAVNYDPRLRLKALSVNAVPDNNAIIAFVDVDYVDLGTTETIKLEFPVGA